MVTPHMNLFRRIYVRFRSAVTGRWVSGQYAKNNPDTTVSERETKWARGGSE